MAKITFLAEAGCLFSGITGLIDAFSIANLWHQSMCEEEVPPLFETEVVTADGKPVLAHGDIPVLPHKSVDAVGKADMILIPPFLPHVEPMPDRLADLLAWITDRYRNRTRIGALCTGVFVLAETGLLNEKIATTNWYFARMFQQRYPRVRLKPDRILTEDSGLICSGAASSFFNMSLHVIETFGSPGLASVCAKALLVDPNRASQAPYMISYFQKDHNDAEILKAQAWMEDNYTGNITIDSVAKQVGISPRHFKRRFKNATGESPLNYLQRVRIEAAKKRLETTRENMNEITWQIGYEDSSSFRRLFKKHTGLSPREYREKFSRAGAC